MVVVVGIGREIEERVGLCTHHVVPTLGVAFFFPE
jgi:hypothetical protein